MENTIKFQLLSDISNKRSLFYKQNPDQLYKKISLQEEIEEIRRQEKDMGSLATNHILLLSAELLKVEECEVSTDDILNQPHDTDDDLLLENVLCSMKSSTLSYPKKLNSERKNKICILKTQLNKLTSSINAEEFF